MKKRLFNENEAFTKDANNLAFKLDEAIRPILEEASAKYPLRDIEVVAVSVMGQVTSELIIRAALDKNLSENENYKTLIISVNPEWERDIKHLLSLSDWQEFEKELMDGHESRLRNQLAGLELFINKIDDKFIIKGYQSELDSVFGHINMSEFEINKN